MNEVDVNKLQDRIDILYHATNDFVNRAPVAEIALDEKTYIDEDGKENIIMSFSGGEHSEQELLSAKHIFTDIVSRLANLKDALKNEIKDICSDPSLVEEHINSSEYLSLIMDLNNSEKHGYPLTKHRRSNVDPKVVNIRKDLLVPLVPGKFTNAFTETIVVFAADVVNLENEILHDFRDVIDNAITAWEDFCILHLKDKCTTIIKRRDLNLRQEIWQEDHNSRGQQVSKILNQEKNWQVIHGNEVIPLMFVKAIGKQENSRAIMGYPCRPHDQFVDEKYVPLIDVEFGHQTQLSKEKNSWSLLVVDTQEELKLVNDYYWELHNPPKFEL